MCSKCVRIIARMQVHFILVLLSSAADLCTVFRSYLNQLFYRHFFYQQKYVYILLIKNKSC